MKKVFVGLILLGLVLIGISIFWFINGRPTASAALQITSVPSATVFLDGKPLGKTPFRENVTAGEHLIKILPEGAGNTSFEQRVSFLSNILTVIDRSFEETGAHGHILSLSPLSSKDGVHIQILSTPTGAAVYLDSELKGITPLVIDNITSSDHEILLNKEDYKEKSIRIKAVEGYQLTVQADLAINLNPQPETATSSAQLDATQSAIIQQPNIQVSISQTPTGFLRVRFEPSLSASEVARVKPGESFPFLEEKAGWFKILLPDGTEGWISKQYAQKTSE